MYMQNYKSLGHSDDRPSHEENKRAQRVILYKEQCLYCDTISVSCLYGRSSDNGIVTEYCLCAKDKLSNQSYICMQCGERRKTSQGIKNHMKEHVKRQDVCSFCDLDLSTLKSLSDCIAHLNTHFPYAHGLVIPSKGKIESVKSILDDNKSGEEKEQYRNSDKEEYIRTFFHKTDNVGVDASSFDQHECEYEPPLMGNFADDEVSLSTLVLQTSQSDDDVDILSLTQDGPTNQCVSAVSGDGEQPLATTNNRFTVPEYTPRTYKYTYQHNLIKQLMRVPLFKLQCHGPFGTKECYDLAGIYIRRKLSMETGKELFELISNQKPESFPNSYEEFLNCIESLPVIEPLIDEKNIVVYEICDLIRYIFANERQCKFMNFEDTYKSNSDFKIWKFQQTRDYHKMVKQARRLDPDAVPLPFQWCYDAFSNFSNFGISTGGSYLQPLFYDTRHSHMAENLLIHGFCKSSLYDRMARALVDNFDRLRNGVKVYNESSSKWTLCVPFLVFTLGDTPQRADFCSHCHHNAEEGCPYCNCKKSQWVMRSSLMRTDLRAKTMKESKEIYEIFKDKCLSSVDPNVKEIKREAKRIQRDHGLVFTSYLRPPKRKLGNSIFVDAKSQKRPRIDTVDEFKSTVRSNPFFKLSNCGFDIHRDSHPELLHLIPLGIVEKRFEVIVSSLSGDQKRLLRSNLDAVILPRNVNVNLKKETKDWQADEYLALIGVSHNLFNNILLDEKLSNWREFSAICWKLLRRALSLQDLDNIETDYVKNFDRFQALYMDKLDLFSNSINCHSIFHAFHTCRRVACGIMIWAKVMEIKHKSCKDQIRCGNKRDVIQTAAKSLQKIFYMDMVFPKDVKYSKFVRVNHDVYVSEPSFELEVSHDRSMNFSQVMCVKYLHKDIHQGSVICVSNDEQTDVDTVFVDHILVNKTTGETEVLFEVTVLKLIPTEVPFEFSARSTSRERPDIILTSNPLPACFE